MRYRSIFDGDGRKTRTIALDYDPDGDMSPNAERDAWLAPGFECAMP